MFKQLITTTAIAVGFGLASASGPALADAPVEFTVHDNHPNEVNPCTQENFSVDLTFNVRLHVHRNSQVAVVDTTAETSQGHFAAGHDTQVVTPSGLLVQTFNVMNEHPTTGEKFSVKGHIRLDTTTGEVFQDSFRMRCIRPAA